MQIRVGEVDLPAVTLPAHSFLCYCRSGVSPGEDGG